MSNDEIHVSDNDPLNARLAEMQAEADAKANALTQEPETIEEAPEATKPEQDTVSEVEASQDTSETVQEPSEETNPDHEYQERIKRAHIEAREAKRRAKLLEQELAVLRGTQTETRDESITREAHQMAQQIAVQNDFLKETQRIASQIEKNFGSVQSVINAFATSFPEVGGIPTPLIEAAIEAGEGQEHKILHWLSNNLDEAERIAGLPPARQGAAVAKIAQKLNAPKPVTKMTTPIKPVSGQAKAVATPAKDVSKMSSAELQAHFDEEDRKERIKRYS